MRRVRFLSLFLFAVSFCFLSACPEVKLSRKEQEKTYRGLELFSEALAKVQTRYVDKKSPKDLTYGALKGLLGHLDPYSQFLEPDDYKDLISDTEGEFGGLGIEISIKDGLLTVISPLEGTPAWDAGIKAGDRIVRIEGEVTRGISLTDAVKKLRGMPGTKVKITILREKTGLIKDIEITRRIIKVKDIRKAFILKDKIAYLRISEFRENTAQEMDSVLKRLLKQGMQALVLDLRNNPGGLLYSAVDVASRFIEQGKLVVYTQGRADGKKEYKSIAGITRFVKMPIAVLINSGSASGSEIVAGCLQDYRRAVIVGTKSFGKASVQTIIPLSDGSALRLTTAKYYTPKGRLISNEGIHPDIVVEYKEQKVKPTKEEQVFEKVEEKDKKESKEEKEIQRLYYDDNQVQRAVDLLKALLIVEKSR